MYLREILEVLEKTRSDSGEDGLLATHNAMTRVICANSKFTAEEILSPHWYLTSVAHLRTLNEIGEILAEQAKKVGYSTEIEVRYISKAHRLSEKDRISLKFYYTDSTTLVIGATSRGVIYIAPNKCDIIKLDTLQECAWLMCSERIL